MPSNRMKLEICGSTYVITTTDEEEYVLYLADKLDKDMGRILDNTPSATVTSSAIIIALGYLDELQKTDKSADNMREQIRNYLEDATRAKQEVVRANQEIERLQREIDYLRRQPRGNE
jgi:Uncharacterized protein conserved in bacteria